MRKFIVYLATSADGFIARPDGAYDFLDRPWPKHQYGMPQFVRSVDTIIMGRKSWELGGGAAWGKKKVFVMSRRPQDGKGVEFFSDAGALARTLRAMKSRKNVWLFGGAESIAAFLDAGEVDELMLFVVPVLIGDGIPLLSPKRRTVELSLIEAKPFEDGVVLHHYAISRGE